MLRLLVFLNLCILSSFGHTQSVRLINASPSSIEADVLLSQMAYQLAKKTAKNYCVSCHGIDLRGKKGVPDLFDEDTLWGSNLDYSAVGAVMQLQRTILYGIRDRDCPPEQQSYGACSATRFSQMPGYQAMKVFNKAEIDDLVAMVKSFSDQKVDPLAVERAKKNWIVCTECHGEYGEGNKNYGGTNLNDDIWLYGGSDEQIFDVIANGREGYCPPWADKLTALEIKSLAIYIHKKPQ